MHIFLDESGNFTKDRESYFILGGFITNNSKRTAKAFRIPEVAAYKISQETPEKE
jgi:hypothetical protein